MTYHRPDAFKRVHVVSRSFPLASAGYRREVAQGALSRQDLQRIVAAMVD
ncbi:MAG: hypothetical protein K0R64_285 [Novosphingobium lindaniclasticum]|jgi:hypothetical protein|nr:hypothetical protein [Novosphingobium lindaniclasticum]MDF2637301.1 hypothetical protein [Novosphingobium lindaniclasticum]